MPPASYREPKFGQRLLARAVDGVLLVAFAFLVSLVLDGVNRVFVVLAASALYEVLLVAYDGQTLGKRVVGLAVVDDVSGDIPTTSQAVRRWLVLSAAGTVIAVASTSWLAFVFDLAVLLLVLQPPLHRGLHDRAAGTIVMKER
jgi:uncharacterized RDD family membrane protein YckC